MPLAQCVVTVFLSSWAPPGLWKQWHSARWSGALGTGIAVLGQLHTWGWRVCWALFPVAAAPSDPTEGPGSTGEGGNGCPCQGLADSASCEAPYQERQTSGLALKPGPALGWTEPSR